MSISEKQLDSQELQSGVYEAPRIEAVLTPEELEREVLYAGLASQTP